VLAGLLVLTIVPIAVVRRARPWRLLAGAVGNMPAGGLRMRHGFLLAQVTLTCCLLYAAGVVVHSHLRASAFDYGFDSEHVLLFSPSYRLVTEAAHESRDALRAARREQEALTAESVDRLNASPVVMAAARVRAIRVPGVSTVHDEPVVSFNGRPDLRRDFALRTQVSGADPMFLRALGATLIAGNGLDDERHAGRRDVAVVNEALARLLAPPVRVMDMELSQNVIGATIKTSWFEGEIVGIMKDFVDSGPGFPARPQMFVPASHPNFGAGIITIRAAAPVDASLPVIRSTLAEVWGDAPARRFGLMRDEVDRNLAPYRARSILLGLIAVFSLPLAALGLAGGMLALVRSREQEMAIRIALGADPAGARRRVTVQGLSVVAAALVPGVALGAVLARVVAHQLFEVEPADPASMAAVAVVFLVLGWVIGQVAGRPLLRVDRLTTLLRS
jgi:putative ABC transport system permease protein